MWTARGSYATPAFMPVGTRGAVKALDSVDLGALGAEVVLANTYHLMLRPGAEVVAGADPLNVTGSVLGGTRVPTRRNQRT